MSEKTKIKDKIKRGGERRREKDQRQKEEFFLHLEIQDNDETIEEPKLTQNRDIKSAILQLKLKSES